MGILGLVAGWFRPAAAKEFPFADVAAFRAFVMAAIRRQPGVVRVEADPRDPAGFTAMFGDLPFSGHVTNLFGYLRSYPDEDVDAAVNRFVKSLVEARPAPVKDGDVVAVIRSRDYIDGIHGQMPELLYEPLGADLAIVYMADRPDSMAPLSKSDLPGKDLAGVRKLALTNLRPWLSKVVSDGQLGDGVLYYVEENTMLSTSLLLLDEFWAAISTRFPGDVLIALPRKDQLFVFDDSRVVRDRVRGFIAGTWADNFNLLSPRLYGRRGGKIVEVVD